MTQPSVTLAAYGIVLFAYAAMLGSLAGFPDRPRDALLFLFAGVLLAPLSFWLRSRLSVVRNGQAIEAATVWVAAAMPALLVATQQLVRFASGGMDTWSLWSHSGLVLLLALHGVVVARLLTAPGQPVTVPTLLARQDIRNGALAAAMLIATILLFRFDPESAGTGEPIGLLIGPPLDTLSESGRRMGLFASALVIALAGLLLFAEPWVRERHSRAAALLAGLALFVAMVSSIGMFFDFSLQLEVLHYLTNVAPALHMQAGGTPMVDTFSQYGPAPVVLTRLAFALGPDTLGTAQVMVQAANLAFFCLWLACLWRMSAYRLAAMLLGVAAIGLQLAVWDFGNGNLAVAPSILGLRHLPTLLLVFALSTLRPPNRHSGLSLGAVFLAGLWSFETLVGTLGVYFGFLAFQELRRQSITGLIRDGAIALAPVFAAVGATCLGAWLRSGQLPRYDLYLRFFGTYNPLSEFWAFPTNPAFFGWMVPLLAIFLVFANALARRGEAGRETDTLYYRTVPMALFVLPTGAYFAFRSYDYTLAVALLPTMALIIPAALNWTYRLGRTPGTARLLTMVPALIGFWLIAYAGMALGRAGGPYSFALQECRDHGRCSAAALASGLDRKLHGRDVLEPVGNFLSDRWMTILAPQNLLPDAVDIIEREAPADARVTVLLGQSIASELALLHTGKWQHWPISFVYTDQLVSRLARKIAATPVDLPAGALIVVAPGDGLGSMERSIWQRLQDEHTLCAVAETSGAVDAYRIGGPDGCPQ